MTDFHKIPFLISGFMTVLVGIISYSTGAGSSNKIYLHMMIAMVLFYLIGKFTVETIEATIEEVDIKKKEAEQAEAAAIESAKGKNIDLAADGKPVGSAPGKNTIYSPGMKSDSAVQKSATSGDKPKAAPVAESQDDSFEPLTVSRVISTAMKK